VARSKQSSVSRFPATGPSTRSPFQGPVRNDPAYDYWATSPQLTSKRRGSRAAPLAPDVFAPLGEPPRYYGVAWQVILWLTCSALLLLIMFG
jgi:hypothetical protein